MTEIYEVDLDEELLAHLPDYDSWLIMREQGFDAALIEDDEIQKIYEWQVDHVRGNKVTATASVLADEFDLLQINDPITTIGDLLDKMRSRHATNETRKLLEKGAKLFRTDPTAVTTFLVNEGNEIRKRTNRSGEKFTAADTDRAITIYEEKMNEGEGPSLGFKEIDEYFYGQKGLTFFVAPPKTYKSWMLVNALIENVKNGRNAWLYSLELPAEETDMRLRCMAANVPWWKYTKNQMNTSDLKMIEEASELLDALGTYQIVKPPSGARSVDDLIIKAQDSGADVVFIDQLQYVEWRGHSLGEKNETGEYFGALERARDLSDEIPICFAHQFNRTTLNLDKMPDIKQSKSSAAIEETATLALGLWANKDMRQSHLLEVGTLITRNAMFLDWEVKVNFSVECNFEMIGKVENG